MRGSDEERHRTAGELQRTRAVVASVYLWLLLGVILFALGFAAVILLGGRLGSNSQGEYYYFGVAVLLVLGWLGGKVLGLKPRKTEKLQLPPMRANVEDVQGGRLFRFEMGADPRVANTTGTEGVRTFNFSRSLQGRVATGDFAEHLPDDAALATAADFLAQGRDWDFICAWINPAYTGWDASRRVRYLEFLQSLLARRPGGPPTAG